MYATDNNYSASYEAPAQVGGGVQAWDLPWSDTSSVKEKWKCSYDGIMWQVRGLFHQNSQDGLVDPVAWKKIRHSFVHNSTTGTFLLQNRRHIKVVAGVYLIWDITSDDAVPAGIGRLSIRTYETVY